MKLVVSSVTDPGALEKERVIMRVESDINLTSFALFCCRKGKTAVVAGDVPYVYWFWDQQVKKGDLVVVYTKRGERSQKTFDDGTTTHFYYWAKDAPIWTDDHIAVSVFAPQWKMLKA